MNKNKEYIYITRTMKINVPALICQDAVEKIQAMKKQDLIPKEKGVLYTRCKVNSGNRNKYEL